MWINENRFTFLFFQLTINLIDKAPYTQSSVVKMLNMSYIIHFIAESFLFMKQYAYLCTKMNMYGTKYLPSCLD